MSDSKAPYSTIDRAIHKLAFRSKVLQEILNDIESSLFSKQWKNVSVTKPIFITSLPRAGTTIILESLYKLPGLTTHTYRNMPFILTPVLWRKVSGAFSRKATMKERAHGDGLVISEDSPEAFEEVLWKKHFPKYYSQKGIRQWTASSKKADKKFLDFFYSHIKKMIMLGQEDAQKAPRYISKNNTNIARIDWINQHIPDAIIIIPLRDPIEHAISLWRQHENFLVQHEADDFSRQYMEDIGHYEFGMLHKPIQFSSLAELTAGLTPGPLDYWLAYWIAAFESLTKKQNVSFLCYEDLCEAGIAGLKKLCVHLELEVAESDIREAANVFNAPPAPRRAGYSIDEVLVDRSMLIYQELQLRCLLKN